MMMMESRVESSRVDVKLKRRLVYLRSIKMSVYILYVKNLLRSFKVKVIKFYHLKKTKSNKNCMII